MRDEQLLYHQARANIYKLLSVCYYEPSQELREILINLEAWLAKICPEVLPGIQAMALEMAELNGDVQGLMVDYAKLFVGPFDVLAAPYGSIYLESERKVMGSTSIDACHHYQAAGLKLDNEFKDAPDHVAVELEFMYYLIFRGLNAGQGEHFKRQLVFLQHHLGAWVGSFAAAVQERAGTEFYRSLAKATAQFIELDLEKIRSLALN